MNNQSKKMNYLWLALYVGLALFSMGRWQITAAALLAPIFAIRFYRDSDKGGRAFLLLWLASAITSIIAWHDATSMHFLGAWVEPLFFAVLAPIALIPYVIDRLFYRRWTRDGTLPFWTTLVFPISVTAVDFLSSSGSPFGSFGAAAYSQTGFTALMQVSSITGLWGIPFIIGWFASVVNFAWDSHFQWAKIRRGVLIYAGVMILVLGFGAGRMILAAPAEKEVQIGGFSLPGDGIMPIMALMQEGDGTAFREATAKLHEQELAQVRTLAQQGAEIVVLQEAAGLGFAEEVETLLANAYRIVQEEGIYLVLPTAKIDPAGEEPFHNVVRIIDPNGDVVLEHYKYGGTQFEGSVSGSGELQTVETPFGTLSAVICWDADFPNAIKQAGDQDVDLLFVPSNDWYELRDIHDGMATFRAVENGVSIFRQTGAGVSSVIDAYGRVVNRVDMFEEEGTGEWAAEQMVLTPVGSVDTLYPRIGDAFGWLMLIGLGGLVVFAVIKRK